MTTNLSEVTAEEYATKYLTLRALSNKAFHEGEVVLCTCYSKESFVALRNLKLVLGLKSTDDAAAWARRNAKVSKNG